jgi:hypothetical protein
MRVSRDELFANVARDAFFDSHKDADGKVTCAQTGENISRE